MIMAIILLMFIILSAIFSAPVEAATIKGTIYDFSLRKVNNAIVEIDTKPKQLIVASNASYSFHVPNGVYIIKAQLIQNKNVIGSAQENISIRQDGDYVLDIILFPNIEEGLEEEDLNIDEPYLEEKNNFPIIIPVLAGIVVVSSAGLFYFFMRKKQAEKNENPSSEKASIDDELKKIIEILHREGGRTTQKEIRAHIPLSEAKISLMIAELESKGIVEKIKKGRGNIIILKKR